MKSTRRNFVIGALISFFSSVFPAAHAAGPTLIPTKLGQTIIWRGKKYTAIKSGKKLIWNQGVSIPTPTPSNKVSTSPSPMVSNVNPTSSSKSNLNIVGKISDLSIGETKIFKENDPYGRGARYVITRTSTGLIAFDNTCTHEGCSVEQILTKNQIRCGCHGAEYNAITGEAIKAPAYQGLRQVSVSEVNGEILIG